MDPLSEDWGSCHPLTRIGIASCAPAVTLEVFFRVGSWLSYLLLHAVLSHRVTALGKHLSSVFCQREEVLKRSTGRLLCEHGQVAGQAQVYKGLRELSSSLALLPGRSGDFAR